MIFRKLIIAVFLVFTFFKVDAQTVNLCGTVYDANTKKALPFVNVWIENTISGTITNNEGQFCINLTSKQDTAIIKFTHLSYKELSYKVILNNDNFNLEIYLKSSATQLSEVVVSADKNKTSCFEQTIVPITITNSSIIENGSQNIPEILIKQPGVSLAGQAYHSAPSIRGLARKRVLVMLDGEKISSERNVGAPGTFLNPFEIENIEILKGPYSVLYGSDAVGGIVNIISKSYEQPFYNSKVGGRLDLSYKSVNSGVNSNLAINGKTKKVYYHINAGIRKADNYKIPQGGTLMNTFYKEQHLGGKIQYNITDNQILTLKTYYSKGGKIGKPAFDTLTNAIHNPDNHFIAGVKYKVYNISKFITKAEINLTRHEHTLGAIIEKHKQDINPNNDKLINNQKNLSNVDYITRLDVYLKINDKLKILTGFDGFLRQNIHIDEHKIVRNYNSGVFLFEKSDTLLNNSSQNSYGIFAQADYLLSKKIFVSGGLRWNYINTKQSHNHTKNNQAFSGNFGISFQPTKQISIKTNIGSAFRSPDIKELYVTTNTPGGLNIANPELVPEHSFNLDFAFIYNSEKTFFEISIFRNQINNMIILDWNTTTANRVGKFKNIGKGLLYGVEFLYNQKISKSFSGNFNITKIYGYDILANDELMDVPPFQINTGIKYHYKNKIKLVLSGRYSAKQTEVAQDDFPTDDFMTFDFMAQWKIRQNLSLNFSVTNILNKKYREHYQFIWMYAPARSFNMGMNFNF